MQTHTRPAMHNGDASEDELKGIAAVVKSIGSEIGALLNNTFRLFACESQERFSQTVSLLLRLGLALGLALIGLSFALTGINSLLVTALAGEVMDRSTAEWIVPLSLGVLTAVIGLILYKTGTRRLDNINIAPKKTVASLKNNIEWARDRAKGET